MAKLKPEIKPLKNEELPHPFRRALPGLGVTKDKLKLTLHFYTESIVLQNHDAGGGGKSFRVVDARDIANALAGELSYGSGMLPENALWWSNSKSGPVTALWLPPGCRRLALQVKDLGAPERYSVPLPGLIFLCRPGLPPWVFAASRRPAGPKDRVYKSPLANVYDNGQTCGGNNKFPADVSGIPDSFLRSFFTPHADIRGRSRKHPADITQMWRELDKKKAKEYPLADLYYLGSVADLMGMRI